ncbi:hypothetical protein GCM10009603_28810 [Nocardiopsis exhalans]
MTVHILSPMRSKSLGKDSTTRTAFAPVWGAIRGAIRGPGSAGPRLERVFHPRASAGWLF